MTIKHLKIICLSVMVFFNSCNKKEEIPLSPHIESKELNKIIYLITQEGNVKAYNKLIDTYEDNQEYPEFLQYVLVMANVYNYPRAHYNVYDILTRLAYPSKPCKTESCNGTVECLDENTRKIAVEYYKKSILSGYKSTSEMLLNYYYKGKECPIKEFYEDKKLIAKARENLGLKSNK